MNIALCTDDKYAFPCGVCITSILENNKNEECNIYILTEGLSESTKAKFKALERTYNQTITILTIDARDFDELKRSNRFPKSIYFRFLLPKLIKGESKILYLDCDIIVTKELKELWNTDISNYACGVIEDQRSDDIRVQNNIEIYDTYFNSGVLLMNLEYWRENDIAKKLTDFIYNNPEKCEYPDQDALNFVLYKKVHYLDYTYNYQELMLLAPKECFLHKSKWHKLLGCNETPAVIHYTGGVKPWILTCTHKFKSEFLKYKENSPWKKEKLKPRYTFIQKIMLIRRITLNILWNKGHCIE